MLLNKIKSKYFENLIQKFIDQGDLQEVKKMLINFRKEREPEKNLLLYSTINQLLKLEKFNTIFKKNLIWVNSYNLEDCSYVNNFISFIFAKNNIVFNEPAPYGSYLNKVSANDINFEQLTKYSYLYQYLISELGEGNIILNNSGAFFELDNSKYFTHYFLSKLYIYIIKNPLTIYKQRKLLNPLNESQEHLYGLTLSAINYSNKSKYEDIQVEENRHNWSTNVSSWTNQNVVTTFKGYILKFEDLANDPQQILSEIVAHMIQCGLKINLDYSHIKSFIDQYPLENQTFESVDISNKVLKILDRDNALVGKKFGYFN